MEATGARPATRTYRPRIRLPEGSPRTGQTRKQLELGKEIIPSTRSGPDGPAVKETATMN